MTIVVTVKVNDGVVLAADSAGSFFITDPRHPDKIYNNALKVFNLVKVWPIGALTYGTGGIGAASIATLSKDLRERLTPPSTGALDAATPDPHADYRLNHASYTVEEVAQKAKRYLFDECYQGTYGDNPPEGFLMGYRACGYSAGAPLPEIWEFTIEGSQCVGPQLLQGQGDYGIRWAGQNEPLDRLILGVSSKVFTTLKNYGIPDSRANEIFLDLTRDCSAQLFLPAMPIQDAIDLATFLVKTAIGFNRYSLEPETIGGPIEVAAITKHEGFKWISRKHYYTADLNREG